MDLGPCVDDLRRQLQVAAAPGGEDARALTDRLAASLDSAVRLTLLEALSAAADEITRDLAPGSVDLRLRRGDPGFVVTLPADRRSEDAAGSVSGAERPGTAARAAGAPGDRQPAPEADDGSVARINSGCPST